MEMLREENLKTANKKIDTLFAVIGEGFRSPYEFFEDLTQEYIKEEMEESFDGNNEDAVEFLNDEKIYIIGFLGTTGEYLFIDLDEEESPVYLYDEEGEVYEVFTLENYTSFAKEVFEIADSDLTDKEKFNKIEALASDLLEPGADDMVCFKLQKCFEI